jgi:hypothetical protein
MLLNDIPPMIGTCCLLLSLSRAVALLSSPQYFFTLAGLVAAVQEACRICVV